MKVLKFGTASIATVDKIKHVADIIAQNKKDIVVLSSIRGTAEGLAELSGYLYKKNIEGALEILNEIQGSYVKLITHLYTKKETQLAAKRKLKERVDFIRAFTQGLFTLFEERAVMAQGEMLSSDIFYFLLKEKGINVAILPALDFLHIDRNSVPKWEFIQEKLKELLEANASADLYLTQGYICRNSYGEIDDLKKGGSDYTASLVGAAVSASEIQIWADVEVMQNSDPNFVDNTFTVRHLNFAEAAELAYFGAKILHPTRIAPAKLTNIPVRLKCTQKIDDEGTVISNETEENTIKAIAARDKIVAIRIKTGEMLLAHGFLRKVFEIFERYQTPVDMITSSEIGVSITIDDTKNLDYIIDDLKKYGTVEVDRHMTIVAIVGDLGNNKVEFMADILDAVKHTLVSMVSYGGSHYNFSLLINERDKENTLKILNNRLFLNK